MVTDIFGFAVRTFDSLTGSMAIVMRIWSRSHDLALVAFSAGLVANEDCGGGKLCGMPSLTCLVAPAWTALYLVVESL
jgi:hypothetical protein